MKGSSEHRVKKTRLGMEGGKRGLKPRASSQPVADGSSLPLPPPSVVWRGQGTTPPLPLWVQPLQHPGVSRHPCSLLACFILTTNQSPAWLLISASCSPAPSSWFHFNRLNCSLDSQFQGCSLARFLGPPS